MIRKKWTGKIPNGKAIDSLIKREQSHAAISALKSTGRELHLRARRTMQQANKCKTINGKKRLLAAAEKDYKKAEEIQKFLHG